MITKDSVQDKIGDLLRNDISLEQFENWLSAASWNMHISSSQDAIDLVSLIHHLLSERDDRILDDAALRDALAALMPSVTYACVRVFNPANSYLVVRPSHRSIPIVLASVQA